MKLKDVKLNSIWYKVASYSMLSVAAIAAGSLLEKLGRLKEEEKIINHMKEHFPDLEIPDSK